MRQTYHQERGKRCCFAMTLLVQRMINDKEQLLLKIHAFELKHGSYFGTCSSPLSVASIYYYLIPLKLRLPFYGSSGLVGHSHCCAGGPNSAVVAMSRSQADRATCCKGLPLISLTTKHSLVVLVARMFSPKLVQHRHQLQGQVLQLQLQTQDLILLGIIKCIYCSDDV